jgi:hypothetical protein
MKDHEHFMENMDELVKSLYQLTLYTPDQAQEAQGKAALEGLKNFHKQVILPTSQRLAFTYSVVGQLIAFLRGIEGLKETLGTKVAAALKERVMVKAEEVGLDKSDALAFMG